MARLFGALANAGAQVNTNRFKRQQYDDTLDAQAREEARRALEFKAIQERQAAQDAEARTQRDLGNTMRAYDNGFEDAPDTTKLRGAGIALDAVTGFRGGAAQYTPPEETPYETEVEGRPVRAAKMGSQYLTIGGKVLRNDRQRGANAVARQEEAKALWDLKMKREVAQENAKAAIEARGREAQTLEGMRGASRALTAGIAAASRPQRRHGKYFTNPKTGQAVWVDEGENPPDGFLLASGSGQGGPGGLSGVQRNVEVGRMKSAYNADPAVKRAAAIAGPVRQIEASLAADSPMSNLSAVYETIKLFDPQTGVREGELKLFGDIASLPQRAQRLIRKWNSGRILTPEMREDIRVLMEEKKAVAAADVPSAQARTGERLRRLGLEADSAYVAPNPLGQVARPATGWKKPFAQRLQEDGK